MSEVINEWLKFIAFSILWIIKICAYLGGFIYFLEFLNGIRENKGE